MQGAGSVTYIWRLSTHSIAVKSCNNDMLSSISKKTKTKLVNKQFKKILKYEKFLKFTHYSRTFCETLVRMFVSVAYISLRIFLRKCFSETGPRALSINAVGDAGVRTAGSSQEGAGSSHSHTWNRHP